jgi:hypothetical protein
MTILISFVIGMFHIQLLNSRQYMLYLSKKKVYRDSISVNNN